jgi:hypothetical protein
MKKKLFWVAILSPFSMSLSAQSNGVIQTTDLYAFNGAQDQIIINEASQNDSCFYQLLNDETLILLSDSNRYEQGVLDAQRLYPKKHTGAGGTFFTCFLLDPVLGLIPALICSSSPPKTENLGVTNADLLNDTEYMRGYTDEAHKLKKKKVWTGFTAGTGAYLVVVAVYLGGQ